MGAMRCPICGCFATQVLDSRPLLNGEQRKRRYECRQCKGRFNTIEVCQATYEGLLAEKDPKSRVDKGGKVKGDPRGEKGVQVKSSPGKEKSGQGQPGEEKGGNSCPGKEELKLLGVVVGGGCDG